MRGKTRPSARFNRFKEDILSIFQNATREPGVSHSDFIYFLENQNILERKIKETCDVDGCLDFDKHNEITALYQIFRLIDRKVLLRDLENLSNIIWKDKTSLYTALSVLIGVNLIDYKIITIHNQIENVLQFFIKDE